MHFLDFLVHLAEVFRRHFAIIKPLRCIRVVRADGLRQRSVLFCFCHWLLRHNKRTCAFHADGFPELQKLTCTCRIAEIPSQVKAVRDFAVVDFRNDFVIHALNVAARSWGVFGLFSHSHQFSEPFFRVVLELCRLSFDAVLADTPQRFGFVDVVSLHALLKEFIAKLPRGFLVLLVQPLTHGCGHLVTRVSAFFRLLHRRVRLRGCVCLNARAVLIWRVEVSHVYSVALLAHADSGSFFCDGGYGINFHVSSILLRPLRSATP